MRVEVTHVVNGHESGTLMFRGVRTYEDLVCYLHAKHPDPHSADTPTVRQDKVMKLMSIWKG